MAAGEGVGREGVGGCLGLKEMVFTPLSPSLSPFFFPPLKHKKNRLSTFSL